MKSLLDTLIKPDWPAPCHVHAYTTTRIGGVSQNNYSTLNLGRHVGDNESAVLANHQFLQHCLGYKQIAWLEQVHSTIVVKANADQILVADANWTDQVDMACVVMTADCLPVLFCDRSGQYVAAAHAGWRGLANGILEETVKQLPVANSQLMAWLGPAIGPEKFEVGAEVRQVFIANDEDAVCAFKESLNQGKFLANIYELAKLRLQKMGITSIYGGGFCTMSDEKKFFSYRREAVTGRMASLIWLSPQ